MIRQINQIYSELISTNLASYDGSQNPGEFAECLDVLHARMKENSQPDLWFLEIGAYKGLWAIAWAVVAQKLGKHPHYVTVTWLAHDPHNQQLLTVKDWYDTNRFDFSLIDADSTLETTRAQVTAIRQHYDVVLIDADHSFAAVTKDIGHYLPMADEWVIFHDINTPKCGVSKAIKKANVTLHRRIAHGKIMGIGIHDRRKGPDSPQKSLLGWF